MSHVATVELNVTDLPALAEACKRLGLEFVEGQKTYHWYGESVGDYPLPAGFTAAELGNCEHAICVPQSKWEGGIKPYEVGVVRRRDGKPGYTLMWDFYNAGYGLQGFVGENCGKLKQAYATVVATRQLMRQGFRVTEQVVNGKINLIGSK